MRTTMKFIRLIAKYKIDMNQTMTLIGCWDENHKINSNIEMYGKIKDWSDDDKKYLYYPFYTESAGANEVFLNWGGFGGEEKVKIDILGRRIAEGEVILRTEVTISETVQDEYVITSIHEY